MPCKDKESQSLSAKKHYQANKSKMIHKAKIFTEKARIRNKEFINNYLLNNPCVDCGEKDIIVLEFDHVRGIKINNVSTGASQLAWSIKKLQKEIDKCEIRCANCHKRITHKRRLQNKPKTNNYIL